MAASPPDPYPMRVGIAGILGRVGRLLVDEVRMSGLVLAGGTARPGAQVASDIDLPLFDDIAALAAASDVVIDFTHAGAAASHADCLATAGVAWVLGTTGLSADAQLRIDLAAARIPIVQAANFSPGVALVVGLARQMAEALPGDAYDAEILEMHHRQKVDAPSGTALALGEAVAAGRGGSLDEMRAPVRDGHGTARLPGSIGFAALRGGQIVGEHTLLFTSGAEQIGLTHRAFDRRVFAAGAVRAARWTATRPPGHYDMQDVLGLR